MELAERYGFHEEAEALHKRQQDMSPDDLEMETFTSEVEVPTEPFRGRLISSSDPARQTSLTRRSNARRRVRCHSH